MTTQIENIAKATSNPGSRIYHRDCMDSLQPTENNRSVIYSRAQARKIFERHPKIETVEYVTTGNKTDSHYIGKRGVEVPPIGVHVIICSTGGKWSKSRREYVARASI
mgnify:CR=1 FL=1